MNTINIVQGFRGEIPYTLIVDGTPLDLTKSIVHFNFIDGLEEKKHTILCIGGDEQGNLKIPFYDQDSGDYGEFYGNFIITRQNGNRDIYPILEYIIVRIRKGVSIQ